MQYGAARHRGVTTAAVEGQGVANCKKKVRRWIFDMQKSRFLLIDKQVNFSEKANSLMIGSWFWLWSIFTVDGSQAGSCIALKTLMSWFCLLRDQFFFMNADCQCGGHSLWNSGFAYCPVQEASKSANRPFRWHDKVTHDRLKEFMIKKNMFQDSSDNIFQDQTRTVNMWINMQTNTDNDIPPAPTLTNAGFVFTKNACAAVLLVEYGPDGKHLRCLDCDFDASGLANCSQKVQNKKTIEDVWRESGAATPKMFFEPLLVPKTFCDMRDHAKRNRAI